MKRASQVKHRYVGKTAAEYDAKRMNETRWPLEHEAVRKYLAELPDRSVIADIPVGTGRYAELYAERGMQVVGYDTSGDMLKLAGKRFDKYGIERNLYIQDALEPFPAMVGWELSAVVCTRLLNHFTRQEAKQAVSNLLRCANTVILSVREPLPGHSNPNWHPIGELASGDIDVTVISTREDSRYIMARIRHED